MNLSTFEMFTMAIGFVQIVGGAFASWLWSVYIELKRNAQKQDIETKELKLDIAKNYIHKDDFNRFTGDILAKIDTIKRDINDIQIEAAKK